MKKQEFLDALGANLSGLPQKEIGERIGFYGEMIDDRIESGLLEEDAVADIGSVEEIVAQIVAETPFVTLAKEKITTKRRWRTWEIVLFWVGSPLWLALLISAFAVVISLYAVLWSLVGVCWAVVGAFAGVLLGGIAGGVLAIIYHNVFAGIALIGVGIFSAGLAIFAGYGALWATKGCARLSKKMALLIKLCFVGRERK